MMPPTAPMSDAPQPPLPVNPRMSQPSPKNSFQAQQEADLLGLQEAKNSPGMGTEDLNDQNMAMGAKMGADNDLAVAQGGGALLGGAGGALGGFGLGRAYGQHQLDTGLNNRFRGILQGSIERQHGANTSPAGQQRMFDQLVKSPSVRGRFEAHPNIQRMMTAGRQNIGHIGRADGGGQRPQPSAQPGMEHLAVTSCQMGQKQFARLWSFTSGRKSHDNDGAFPTGGFGRFSALYPFGSNSSLVAHAPPNPAAKPAQPQPGLANEQGIQQALAKVSFDRTQLPGWLLQAVIGILTRIKSAEGAPGHTSALRQTSTGANQTWSSVPEQRIGNRKPQASNMPSRLQGGHQSALAGQGQGQNQSGTGGTPGLNPFMGNNPLATVARTGWAGISPGTSSPPGMKAANGMDRLIALGKHVLPTRPRPWNAPLIGKKSPRFRHRREQE